MSDPVRNTSASDEAVGRVISRLRTRVALLGELDAVTRRRTAAIADERLDAISRLGEARQGIVERLLATSIDLEAAAHDAAGSASPEAMRLVGEATTLLAGIEEADRRDEVILRATGERVRQEIEQVSRADRAGRAYRGPAGGGFGGTVTRASLGDSRTERTG